MLPNCEKLFLKVNKLKFKINSQRVLNHFNTSYNNYYLSLKENILLQRVWITAFVLLAQMTVIAQEEINQNGYNIFYYPSGNISSEGYLVDGKPDGYWKAYYENGNLKSEGNRKQGQLDSIWVFFNLQGDKERLIHYKSDKKNGEELIFSTDDKIIEKYNYTDNKKEGKAYYYYENGNLYKEVEFRNDKQEGKAFEFAPDGRIITFLNFKEGFIRSIEKVNRFNKNGKKKEYWIEYWPNGNVNEEGIWMNGVRNGIFKFFEKNGELKKLEVYRGGKLVDDAEAAVILDVRKEYYEDGKLKLIGSYKDGNKQGVFREYDKNGNIISSHVYQNNTKIGEGIVDAEGKYQGEWKMYYKTGELKATGQYVDGTRGGDWVYYFTNGKIQQKGDYLNGKPHGNWIWYYDDGSILREEQYRKGKEDGLLVEYDKKKQIIKKGEFIDGYKTGTWFYEVNDHKEIGEYIDGEKNGLWKFEYNNGKTNFEGEFQVGIPIGKHQWYYPNGMIKIEGKYKSGEKHGTWKYFDKNGLLDYTMKYKFGEKVKIGSQKIKHENTAYDVN